ncbi:MAG: PD40 domain-containing protein, partial [Anaerolineales bacterium]|nr:PD40 domain-containing protein [Anaerolineales bacterium]
WLPNQQRNYELSFLQATSDEERAEAMAGLASIRPLPLIGDAADYEQSVRELFFDMDDWGEQKAIDNHHQFKENPDKLVRMIKIVYISMVDADGSGHTTGMLAHIADNLGNLEGEDIAALQQEISQWVQGRTLIENDDYENALAAYNNAIAINPNNPATLFERARILTEIGNTSTDQTVSADNYSQALADLDRVVSFILLQPEPEVGEILPTNIATQSPTATKTVVSTSTATPTVILPTSQLPAAPTLESTTVSAPNATAIPTITILPISTALPTLPPPPTPTPRPLPPQFNTRSQWLNLIRGFLQNESVLANALLKTENREGIYPSLFSSSLIETILILNEGSNLNSPTPAPIPPINTPFLSTAVPLQNKIVFQSNRDGDYEIFIMNSDGTNQLQLTFNNVDDNYPVVSLDGTRVLFDSIRDGNWEVYVMNIDGSEQRRLTNEPGSNNRLPTWSPDGQQVAFISDRDGDYEIYTMNVDGSNLYQVTHNDIREGHVSWSVDNRLVYNAGIEDSHTWDIYAINPDGSHLQKLTDNSVSDWSPEWSPDGRFILYLSITGSNDPAIFIMNADGSSGRLLYNSPYYDWGADWTADGSKIIFTSDQDNLGNLYIMDADGSNIQHLTERGSYPSWVR